ncbi:MAG: hydrogenase iron-sulfur subunit [Chloroflexi bacterium]|jgi:ferredoxin|nr:hydrogenase iron-sulfur subunit [Chloroflexota bacterium]
MSKRRSRPPDTAPGADPEKDCLDPEEIDFARANEELVEGTQPAKQEQNVNWGDLDGESEEQIAVINSWAPARAGWLRFLERIALLIERPANRLIGTAQLNPFYHTGTIAVLLLAIVGLTGFYLFVFFKYGFDASYNDVLTRIEEPFIARTIRAIHRYASGALMITTLLHAYRTLFMERFRGPRWLAWITGIVMTILLWFGGVTGYWLIWDQRAQLINDSFVNFLQTVTPFAASYMVMLTEAEISGVSWPLFLSVFAIHLLMFVVPAFFLWLHIKRLKRPKWLPPPYWVVGVGVVVVMVGLLFPAGMLPQGDLQRIPGPITIDPLFLFFLPASGNRVLSWSLWGGLLLLTAVFAVLPWLRLRRRSASIDGVALPATLPKVNIIKDRCNGCTVCAMDCPYGAIQMVERTDGKLHKYIAVEDPSLCVSCGICVGSCDVVAVTMGRIPPVMLWEDVSSRLTLAKMRNPASQLKVIFTCERHAAHGAKSYLEHSADMPEGTAVEVIPLSCVGTAPPDLLSRTLDEDVAEVQVVGCPPDDCTNREGNLWLEQRLVRERVPRLRRPYANAPISAYWLPPDDFSQAVEAATVLPATSGDEPAID